MKMSVRTWPFVLLLLLVGITVFYTRFWRPWRLSDRQLADFVQMGYYMDSLQKYHAHNGRYPATLELVVNGETPVEFRKLMEHWNYPFHYHSDGKIFILVGFGRDHKPDGFDYASVRREKQPVRLVCGKWDADQTVSDLGLHQVCAK